MEPTNHLEYRVLRTREERLAFARSMNMFSTPFMREVLKDIKATQYVLRILTGKNDLKVVQNLTEYRISKLDTRDAVLDVIAVDECGIRYHIDTITIKATTTYIIAITGTMYCVTSEIRLPPPKITVPARTAIAAPIIKVLLSPGKYTFTKSVML